LRSIRNIIYHSSQIQQFYHPLSEIPIVFDSYELQSTTPELIQNAIVQQVPPGLLQYYGALAARGFPSLPDGVSELTITSVETNYILPPAKDLEQKIQTAQSSIEHMKEFLSDTGLNFPEVEFVVAKSSSEIEENIEGKTEGSEIDKIVIYPTQLTEYNIQVEGEAKYGNQILPIGMTIKARKAGGEVEKKTHLSGKMGDLEVNFIYGNILWAQQGSSQLVFETPALEVLHAAVAPIAEQYAKQLVGEANTVEEARNAVHRSDLLDEYVVHGIGRYWFKKLNDNWNLGYDMNKLKQQKQVSSWWLDSNVSKMERYVTQVGPATVIEMYRTNPGRLISEAGLNMK
jgi:hypothetical protein|tara:strand:+ start:635 stop:1666 length:1032 start_codon:yes stop_codon:yes gene_type:complete